MASIWKKFPIAEKNLLKIMLSNRYVQLQVVNNKTGHIFLSASTKEKQLRETLRTTSCKQAAQACAGLLARRAREIGHQQITWERHNSFAASPLVAAQVAAALVGGAGGAGGENGNA